MSEGRWAAWLIAGALCTLAGLFGSAVRAAGLEPVRPALPAPEWEFQLSLYGWATALSGDIGVRNLPTASVNMPISKVLSDLDGALMGSFFANNGEWLFLADIVYARLSDSGATSSFGGSQLDAGVTQAVATGAFGYMLPTGRPDLDFAVTAGLRYLSVKGSLSFDPIALPASISASARQWWIDPTIGLFGHWEIDEKWFVNAIADIGGFGVGSKLSSTGYMGVGYMWTSSFSTSLGYRYLYEDYEGPGAKTGTFRYNTVMHGPTLAVAWRF